MDRIDEALAALALQDIPNYKRTAIEYGVNRTTLSRRHRGLCKSRGEAKEYQYLLSHQQQKVLVEHINSLSEAGIPPTPSMVRVFAFEISQTWPGNNWVSRFVETHKAKLKSAYLCGFDLKRKKADNYYLIKKYFDLVGMLNISLFYAYNSNRLLKKSPNMVSSDITATTWTKIGKLQKTKRIFNLEHWASGKLMGAGEDGNREWITLIGCICADGHYIPPSVIYSAKTGNVGEDSWSVIPNDDPG
jgi:hypothetical protein